MKPILTGIILDDNTQFINWANAGVVAWINAILPDIASGSAGSMEEVSEKLDRFTAYQGTICEYYSIAKCYYDEAVARELEKIADKYATMTARKIAEGKCKNEEKVYLYLHRINSTLNNHIMAIFVRLKHEGSKPIPYAGKTVKNISEKDMPF
jgi:hypothetical protein